MKTLFLALFLTTLARCATGSSTITIETVSGGVRTVEKVSLTDIGSTMSWGGGSLPTGVIVMWSGTLANIPSGWGLCDGTSGRPNLVNSFVKGVATSGTNPGDTGGSATHTPTGTNSAPTFTGNSVASSLISAGTPAGTNVAETSHTHSVTSNVAVADHASHTHTYTDVVNHTHTVAFTNVASATTGGATTQYQIITKTTDTSSTQSDLTETTSNPSGGVASGTTAGPSATLTHSVTNNAVTSGAGSSHTHVFIGSAMGTHQHTTTATGSVSAPTFTGDSANTEPVYYAVAFIIKL